MKKLFIIGLLSITMSFAVYAKPYEFDNDANFSQLEECKDFFIKEKDVKTIKLLNGKKIELKDEFLKDDIRFKNEYLKDLPGKEDLFLKEFVEEKTLVYTMKGCFLKEKYLIYSAFVVESWEHYAVNLNNGKVTPIDGMTYLSPNRKYFVTGCFVDYSTASLSRISVYSFNKNKIIRIFTQEYPHNCSVQKIKWIDKLKLTHKAGKWITMKSKGDRLL